VWIFKLKNSQTDRIYWNVWFRRPRKCQDNLEDFVITKHVFFLGQTKQTKTKTKTK